ncbi:L-fuconate dehydratase [Fodinibius sediminis]|uniref:L-fuconate dehydratase n=1 Tax=Fodinibius sediminis TaxID=1214077 RepID=A0A521C4K7_9BACT|nr:L-fuconate dehydratase [Fodinibius sediminis]SMO54323.1 L-fuconate dehydratase [Fodinibius sediminis]
MTDLAITEIEVKDIRFPTSQNLDGSDAMNPDPDYSAAYVILKTGSELEGHGLTFTIGRGNDLCVEAIRQLGDHVLNRPLEDIKNNFGAFWRQLARDSQLRWLGPEKGVIHLAMGALVNALWDLYAKMEGKPLWRLLADMSPEEIVNCIDFSYITDVLTPDEALQILRRREAAKGERIKELMADGYPAYTTSAGWLGYSDEKIRRLCAEAVEEGWGAMKMKVGSDLDDDLRRAALIREEIGWDRKLMMDANQKWGVEEAIRNMEALSEFDPWWIEEPTSPDDILGHARIAQAIAPVQVATGEHAQNRIIFKQMMQVEALDICQIDSCRVGGVNENLAIMLMAAKFGIPVCPHAGGVGLCEYVQHLSMFDYIAISGTTENRMIEYVDHLHEHFLHPVVISEGCYQVPEQPGFSIQMKEESLEKYSYPGGPRWQQIANLT